MPFYQPNNTLWPISVKYIIYTGFSHLICGFSVAYIPKGDPVSSLCRFLLSSLLQWWVCSGLWVLVRINVRGFWFCCGSTLEVYEFLFYGFCFESLVLGLVLAWITSLRFWFESLILGLLVVDGYKVLDLCTDADVVVLLMGLWLLLMVCAVSGLWMIILGSWILLMVSHWWSFVIRFHSSFFFLVFHWAKCSSFFFFFNLLLIRIKESQKRKRERVSERDEWIEYHHRWWDE